MNKIHQILLPYDVKPTSSIKRCNQRIPNWPQISCNRFFKNGAHGNAQLDQIRYK